MEMEFFHDFRSGKGAPAKVVKANARRALTTVYGHQC